MEQVAKMANVGKGTIYTFFKNKEELFDEILSGLFKEMKFAAEEVIDTDLPFFEKVHRALLKMLEFRKRHQLAIMLFQEEKEMGTPAVQEMVKRFEAGIIEYIKQKVEIAIKKDEIKECDPKLTAFTMVKLYVAYIFDWEKGNEPLTEEQILQFFKLYLLDGLSK